MADEQTKEKTVLGCPTCGGVSGHRDVDGVHWTYCDAHGLRWRDGEAPKASGEELLKGLIFLNGFTATSGHSRASVEL